MTNAATPAGAQGQWPKCDCTISEGRTPNALQERVLDMIVSEPRRKSKLPRAAMCRSRGLNARPGKRPGDRGFAAAACIFSDQLRIHQLWKEELGTFHTHFPQVPRCHQIMCHKRACRQRAHAAGSCQHRPGHENRWLSFNRAAFWQTAPASMLDKSATAAQHEAHVALVRWPQPLSRPTLELTQPI